MNNKMDRIFERRMIFYICIHDEYIQSLLSIISGVRFAQSVRQLP
jgi:hypothetical protein